MPGSSPDTDTQLPVFIGGRYRLESQIGHGGAGEVWAATDTVLGRRVAVKLLREHLRGDVTTAERFRREATAAAKLAHPNVVTIYDIGAADEDQPYLVMELVEGPSVADVLSGGPVDPDTAVSIAHQVSSALGAAHDQELVHRDIKPANVLVSPAGVVKVADFGVAKALGGAAATLTGDGTVVGTAAYLAPEQVTGDGTGPSVDVYAVGLLLWELLVGRSPFGDGTITELFARRLSKDVPPVPGDVAAPDELVRIVRTATRRAANERFPDGGALAAALAPLTPPDPGTLLRQAATTRARQAGTPRTAVLDRTVAHDALGTTRIIRGETVAMPLDDPDRTAASPSTDADTGATRARPPEERTADATRAMPPATPDATRPMPPATPDATRAMPPARAAGSAAAARGGAPRSAPAAVPAAAPTAPPSSAGPTGDDAEPERASGDDRRYLPVAIAVVLVIALVGLLGRGGDDGSTTAGGTDDAAAETPLTIAAGGDHDPFGDREHPEDIPAAFDGDGGTYWTTQRYESADFGGLKSGVGMWVDLGEPAAVSRVELDLGVPGAAVQVHAMDGEPGADTAAWGEPVGRIDEAPSATVIDLAEPVEARYWLVWFTALPDDGRGHRTRIEELRLFPG